MTTFVPDITRAFWNGINIYVINLVSPCSDISLSMIHKDLKSRRWSSREGMKTRKALSGLSPFWTHYLPRNTLDAQTYSSLLVLSPKNMEDVEVVHTSGHSATVS